MPQILSNFLGHVHIALNGFLCVFKNLAYANKSNSKEGNKPNAIFNTIAITATA